MKKIRLTAFILSLASCLFLFSAGFSTWFKVVLPTNIDPATGEFTAYSVVDVVSSGKVSKDTFQYTSFDFATATSNKIIVEYDLANSVFQKTNGSYPAVNISLSYENLSAYATNDNITGLFANMCRTGTGNSITVKIESESNISYVVKTHTGTSSTMEFTVSSSNLGHIKDDTGVYDSLVFLLVAPEGSYNSNTTDTITITYTFNIDSTENKGNFRQNMGKYLMAGKDGKYTKFISTVVASSSAS